MESQPLEDVSQLRNGEFPACHVSFLEGTIQNHLLPPAPWYLRGYLKAPIERFDIDLYTRTGATRLDKKRRLIPKG